ncbi:Replication Fork Protection Component Swi3 domain containing protein [Rhypophila decipiens]
MPAKTNSSAPNKAPNTKDFVEDYLADWGNDEDPFRSPSPQAGAGGAGASKKSNGKKRKGDDALGLEEQLDVAKKARVPRVKLDETRLLSDKGIPELQKRAKKLRLKGKGHEFSDASRLLSFYQQWLDDLFPKATFLDALAMVEKVGHKTLVKNARLKWIDESKPKPAMLFDDDEDPFNEGSTVPRQASRIAPIFEKSKSAAPDHPGDDDLSGDDDIYNASPRRNVQPLTAGSGGGDVPDEDDLDALMAEAEAEGNGTTQAKVTTRTTIPNFVSIFGGGSGTPAPPKPVSQQGPSAEPDEDEMDALLAEAEAQSAPAPSRPENSGPLGSIFGGGPKPNAPRPLVVLDDDDDDLDALMAEAEAQAAPPASSKPTATTAQSTSAVGGEKAREVEKAKPTTSQESDYDDDDLDAFIAEAEGLDSGGSNLPVSKENGAQNRDNSFAEDEEAMAEMEGLW